MDENLLKRIIEALLFVSHKPLTIEHMAQVLEDEDSKVIRDTVYKLKEEYDKEGRSFILKEIAGGFQFVTDLSYAHWIKKLFDIRKIEKLTGPSLETLAIIAYKQLVTKSDIEAIRGVNVDSVLEGLLDKKLIREKGRKDTIGRPILYGTSDEFLQHFGLNSLEELPRLEELAPPAGTLQEELIKEELEKEASAKDSAVNKTDESV